MYEVHCKKCFTSYAGSWRDATVWIIDHYNCESKKCTAQVTVNYRAFRCKLDANHTDNHLTIYENKDIRWFKDIP